jgi:putative ABC transport system permease protein
VAVDSDPHAPPAWRRYLRFWGPDPAADVDAELEFHLASRIEELTKQGRHLSEARRTALAEFGDYASVRREVQMLDQSYERRRDVIESLADLGRDARYALRSLRKSPGFAVVVVFTMSLGIGLNSTMFSLVNAYLFRPAPIPSAERLVVIGNISSLLKQPHEVPYRDLQAYRELRGVFEDLVGTVLYTESLDQGDRTDRIWVERTTGNYFSSLRVPMELGRGYTEDASNRGEHVVVLSHEFWSRRFAADSGVLGRTLRIQGESRTVIGVAARVFHGFAPMVQSDGWSPIDESPAARRQLLDRQGDWFNVYGLLRAGTSVDQARTALSERSRQLRADFPSTNKDVEPVLVPETRARPAITVAGALPLMAAVVLSLTLMVLVVSCANVASLLLARGTTKHREVAVCAALGASRWRLTRQALMEAAILSFSGAIGAVVLARWSTRALARIRLATDAPLFFDFTPDWRVFAFTMAAAVVTMLLAGLLPALRNASASPHAALVGGGRSATDRAQQRLRSIIVVAQIAVSAIVVIAAGLFARSMRAAETMQLGFKTDNVLMAQFDLSLTRYDSARTRAFQRDVLARARALPGVENAALAARVPFGYSNNAQNVIGDRATRENPDGQLILQNVVSPDYFRTAGPAIVRGREFVDADDASSPRVAIINEAMARELWPNQDPIGRTLRVVDQKEELRVVGIARTAQYMFLGEPPRPFFWTALGQHPRADAFLEIVTSGAPESLIPAVRRVVRDLDPNVPLFEVRSMKDHLRNGRALFTVRLGAIFGGTFALLALALATVGLYGLVSYSVSNRTREIGIRIAIGATMPNVVGLVLRQGVTLALIGVGLGAVAALGITRIMSSLLYGVRSHDPLTFVLGPVALGVVSVLASWFPARRAAAMDPVRALRVE